MAKWGKCDFSEFEKLEKEYEKLAKTDVEKFCKDVAKELAARLLSKVIPRTPVGEGTFEVINEKKYTIKSGGTLRRGWTANTEAEAESGSVPDPTTYADSLKIFKFGNNCIVIVENPVKYASYVEYGHRQEPGRYVPALGKRLKQSWVEGKYMLTISEKKSKPNYNWITIAATLIGFSIVGIVLMNTYKSFQPNEMNNPIVKETILPIEIKENKLEFYKCYEGA